jgi:cytochrome c553
VSVPYEGRNFIIFGFTDNAALSGADSGVIRIVPPVEAAQDISKKLKKKKGDVVVLLLAVEEGSVEKVADLFPAADLIICAQIPRYNETPARLKRAWVVSESRQTRNIQGLSFNIADSGLTDLSGFKVALEAKYDKHPAMDAVFEEYANALKKEKLKYPRPKDAQKLYAGVQACAACHPHESERWNQDPHKKAIEPLIREGQQYNPTCLNCHVTGFERENGFWDVETSMDMAGVQCEQCHGPLMNHVNEENQMGLSGQAFIGGTQSPEGPPRKFKPYPTKFYVCARCHADKRALSTSPEDAWKTIGHSKK